MEVEFAVDQPPEAYPLGQFGGPSFGDEVQLPSVDVIIPHFGEAHLLPPVIRAVLAQSHRPHHVVLVDDASPYDDLDALAPTFPEVTVVRRPVNGGFVASVMEGLAACTSDFVALLNNDAVPSCNWLETAISHLTHPLNVATLGVTALMIDRHEHIDVAGMSISALHGPRADLRGCSRQTAGACRLVSAMCGGAVVLRRQPFLSLGGFDPAFVAYHEDIHFSLLAAVHGWSWILCTEAHVLHEGGTAYLHGSDRHLTLSITNEMRLLAEFWPSGMHVREWLSLAAHLARVAVAVSLIHRRPRLYVRALREICRDRHRLMTRRRLIRSYIPHADAVLRDAWRGGRTHTGR